MAKKYDTNPLDPDVLRRAEEAREQQTQVAGAEKFAEAQTQFFEAQTRPFAPLPTTEMSAENADNMNLNEPYQSVFDKPESQSYPAHNSVSSAVQSIVLPPTSRPILGLGLPENIAMILPYLPFTLGAIAAVIELLFVSRTETRVRFHAAQGLALHIASWVIGVFLTFIGEFLFFGNVGGRIFQATVTIFFIISIVRVWQGKANHIEALDDVTDFLNEKIKPRK